MSGKIRREISLPRPPEVVWKSLANSDALAEWMYKPLAFLVPAAAVCLVLEMLVFTCLHLYSGDSSRGPIIYWLVVAALCGFLAYGRLVLLPIQ